MSLSGGGSARGMGVVSDRPKPQPQPGGRELKKQRSKREDHTHVKHDDFFSDWKVLVGPNDWKEHASGKIPDRFQISNLPSNYNGTGLYELGVTPPAWLPPQRSHDCLKRQDVVVVYLGCTENVHQRLLRYGQTGAHLEGVRSTRLFAVKNDTANRADGSKAEVQIAERSRSFTSDHERNLSVERGPAGDGGYMSSASRPISNASMDANDEAVQPSSELKKSSPNNKAGSRSPSRGPRLFSEVFALGCSIAFRWAVTASKADAEKAEADLIEFFDYAWKRGGNFRQRSPDILSKIVMGGALGSNDSSFNCFGDRSTRTWFFFQRTRAGIPITARKPGIEEDNRATSRTDSRVGNFFSLFRSNPGGRNPKLSEFTKFDIPLDRCGALPETGYPCNALPVKGGKRCHLHKDLKNKQINHGKPGRVAHTNQSSPAHDRSGLNANPRPQSPSHSHIPESAESPILPGPEPTRSTSCFPFLTTPVHSAPSSSSPEPRRRGSLSFTSWLRTSEIRMSKSREWADLNAMGSSRNEASPKRSSTYNSILTTCEESQYELPSRSPCRSPSRGRREICGLRLDDGTVCPDPPRLDRKRCEAHKGLRNQAPRSPRSTPMSPNYNVSGVSVKAPGFF